MPLNHCRIVYLYFSQTLPGPLGQLITIQQRLSSPTRFFAPTQVSPDANVFHSLPSVIVFSPVTCDTHAHRDIATLYIYLRHKTVQLHPSTFYRLVHITFQQPKYLLVTFNLHSNPFKQLHSAKLTPMWCTYSSRRCLSIFTHCNFTYTS